jgi:putative ABC transport system permease protein
VIHRRLLSTLVISEVAIALVLLIGAGLMIRSFISLSRVNPGFNPKGVVTMGIGLPSATYPDLPKQARFYDRALTEIRTLPSVESAAAVIRLPMLGFNASTSFTIQGKPVRPGDEPTVDYRAATQDYFKSMGIPLLEGRDFSDREMKEAPDVVIINKTMADRFFSDQHPIGRKIQIFPDPQRWREIIGVVGDVKLIGLEADINPAIYVPMSQNPYPNALRNVFFVVRTHSDIRTVMTDVRARMRSVDNAIPISQVQSMEEIIANSLGQRRLSMALLVVFAFLAALLAAVGIYGVMAYIVAQRTHELGIRMAMGAKAFDVLSLVLRYGLKLTAAGAVIGVAAAFALTRLMSSLLYGVTASDPLTFLGISLFLGVIALLASYLPARRASRVSPIIALRDG